MYNKIPKIYHSVRAFCRCSMSATPISWAMTLAGMVRLVTEHHIATMPYSPHCHITSLPYCLILQHAMSGLYGNMDMGTFMLWREHLYLHFLHLTMPRNISQWKIHPQFSILHPLSYRKKTFVGATHIQDPAGWKETHFPTTHILVVWYLDKKKEKRMWVDTIFSKGLTSFVLIPS